MEIYLIGCFAGLLICIWEFQREKPDRVYLQDVYLCIAAMAFSWVSIILFTIYLLGEASDKIIWRRKE